MRTKHFYFKKTDGKTRRICIALLDTIDEFDQMSEEVRFSPGAGLPCIFMGRWSNPGDRFELYRNHWLGATTRDGEELSCRQLRNRIAKAEYHGNRRRRLWPKHEFGRCVEAVVLASEVRAIDNF